MADPAFVTSALSADPDVLQRNTDVYGRLLETFVATELLRILGWSTTSAQLFHWRENNRHEVDLIIERNDGALIGIEVKASRSAAAAHTSGLRRLRNRYPGTFLRGYVLHAGDHITRFDDTLWALPFSALWTVGAAVA